MSRSLVCATAGAGLILMIWAMVYLRRDLEHASERMRPYRVLFNNNDAVIKPLFEAPLTTLLLPSLDRWSGLWSTTGHILAYHIQKRLPRPGDIVYLYNGLVIVTAFACGLAVSRSLAFAFTLSLALGFGTYNNHIYLADFNIIMWMFLVYEIVCFALFWACLRGRRLWLWRILFVIALCILAMCYEQWLDFVASTICISAYLALWMSRNDRSGLVRLAIVNTILIAITTVYLVIKIPLNASHVAGQEWETVDTYKGSISAPIEDVISNILTRDYEVITLFLPGPMVFSNALQSYGAKGLIKEQNRYAEHLNEYVPMNYVFYWRYAAGALFVLLMWAIYRSWKRSFDDHRWVFPTALLIVVATGHAVHDMIKFRAINAVPLLTYHALTGVLGISCLIAYGTMMAVKSIRSKAITAALLVAVWGLILSDAVTRPRTLNAMSRVVFVGAEMPDPLHPCPAGRQGEPCKEVSKTKVAGPAKPQ